MVQQALGEVLARAGVLAENNFGDVESDGIVGPLGLLVIVVMVIATVLLIRNMNARLRRLPASFDPPPQSPPAGVGNHPVEVPPMGGADSSVSPQPAAPPDH